MISLDAKNQGGPGKDEFKTQFYYKVVCVKKAYDSSKVVKDGQLRQKLKLDVHRLDSIV